MPSRSRVYELGCGRADVHPTGSLAPLALGECSRRRLYRVIMDKTSGLYMCLYQDVLDVLPCGVLETPLWGGRGGTPLGKHARNQLYRPTS